MLPPIVNEPPPAAPCPVVPGWCADAGARIAQSALTVSRRFIVRPLQKPVSPTCSLRRPQGPARPVSSEAIPCASRVPDQTSPVAQTVMAPECGLHSYLLGRNRTGRYGLDGFRPDARSGG